MIQLTKEQSIYLADSLEDAQLYNCYLAGIEQDQRSFRSLFFKFVFPTSGAEVDLVVDQDGHVESWDIQEVKREYPIAA